MRLFVSLVPAAGATATITLVTDQVELHRSYTLLAVPAGVVLSTASHRSANLQARIEARLLASPTLTQQVTVPTTGKGHQPALYAHGLVTFYNQAPISQTIPAGMLLVGVDGASVVTDQAVVVPAAQLPTQGQVSVAAHALQPGPHGNIVADDLDGLCCFAGIAVQNAQAFTGGANARDFPAVGARDVGGPAAQLKMILISQGQVAIRAQVRIGEQLVYPARCSSQVAAHPAVGEEATQVSVQVSVICRAETYNAQEMQSQIKALLELEVATKLGRTYVLQSQIASIVRAVTMVDDRGVVRLHVQERSVWAYQLSPPQLHALIKLIAGESMQKARSILLRGRGIHQATITSTDWWDDASCQSLPADPSRIQLVVINWEGA
jgi:baseplate J-like protein